MVPALHCYGVRKDTWTDFLSSGKVFVYTGILPICKDQDGLAAVLGHEIAHVVARHPAERMSSSIISLGTVALLSLAFDMSGQLASFLMSMLYSLPNSRVQEVSRWSGCE